MIEHVYRRAAAAKSVDAVVVATDDRRIAEAVEGFGGFARLTRSSHRSGTDRLAEVAEELACDIVINVQGDEPLVDPRTLDELTAPLDLDPSLKMATVRRRITDPEDYTNPHVVKVVVDADGNALYFSRAPIPFVRGSEDPRLRGTSEDARATVRASAFKHLGLYAYRRSFLLAFARLQPTPLELAESLEQLRALEHGFRIRTVETEHDSIGVDTPEDLERARRLVAAEART
jgi:3-deoxy-manno-octulosonate cytidylyltransferase (CMP-KDO synthetase)